MMNEGEYEEPFNECVSKRMTVTNYASEKDKKYDIGKSD